MNFSWIDWTIVFVFLSISLFIGVYFKNKASNSLTDFFLAGRNLPWYIAGISMVATTFAADTPLWVAEVIHKHGISGNWLWWNMLIGGIFTTFFFAKLWRRANVLTELEFLEIRYSGPIVKYFRGFKAIYLGAFFNAVIIGWVNAAMIKILMIFFQLDYQDALLIVIGLMVITAAYSTLSGLLGVAITDAIQFILAMGGCIILAIVMVNSDAVGGIDGLKDKLEPWRFEFFPSFSNSSAGTTFTVTILAFLSFVGVQWWASWYPGAEPGGGGYVAQRMMSTKNEKQAVYATLFFQIAHYCLRPWPWILVGLCALVVYPQLTEENASEGFVMAMNDFMPVGLKGLLFTAFLGAYMSTISTQLNWGASYLTNDLYKRLANKVTDKKLVSVARWMTIAIMFVAIFSTLMINTIDGAARFLIASSAGLGMVLILRWYWWRINIWSELSATLAPILGYCVAKFMISPAYDVDGGVNVFEQNEGVLLVTTLFTTIVWITVTFLTQPTSKEVLSSFYEKIKPDGWWGEYADESKDKKHFFFLVLSWIVGVVMTYSILFFIGKLIFKDWEGVQLWGIVGVMSFVVFRLLLNKTSVLK